MANVIKTVLTYPLDGSTRDFNIPFEYLARKFVVVTLIGVDRKVLTLNTDYRFATRTTISLTKAWGTSDGYTTIELRRVTSTTDRLVDFTDGSILRAYDLNVAQIQTMHVAEEARDLTADTIGVNSDGHLDARGRRIVNLANAVDDYDAINLRQVKLWNNSAYQSAVNAKTSETNAKTSEMNALTYSNSAASSATAASTSETNAKTSETNAKTSETNAKTSETNAKTSEITASSYKDAAASSATASAASAATSKAEADRAELRANQAGGARVINGIYPDYNGSVTLTTDDIKDPSGVTVMMAVRSMIDAIFPVGIRLDWPLASLPDNPTLGVKFLRLDGSSFDKTQYPKLAAIYPSGVLPDLRGEFIRGWDNGRGVDSGRGLMSAQGDAIRNLTGTIGWGRDGLFSVANGVFSGIAREGGGSADTLVPADTTLRYAHARFDASTQVPTAEENRPRNIAWNMIVRAS